MIVNSLQIENFRNHRLLSFEFKNGINAFVGRNGSGKTNIVEAIYYLSLARSFRTLDNDELIRKGFKNARIVANVSEGEIHRQIEILITKEGKQVLVNGKKLTKLSELSNTVNVVLFEPKDVMLFRGSPRDRRYFLDSSLSKKSAAYFDYLSRYEKVLRERNEILKSDIIDENLLEANTELLIKLSSSIVNYRSMYVKDINDILIKITRALTGVHESIEVRYYPYVHNDENFEENARAIYKRTLQSDIEHKATSIGIHREDFSVFYKGKDIASFGSQGENRIVALALKLAPYFLIEDREKRPVVVLDDVFSELDQTHKMRLLRFTRRFEQVFITSTRLDVAGVNLYEIQKK